MRIPGSRHSEAPAGFPYATVRYVYVYASRGALDPHDVGARDPSRWLVDRAGNGGTRPARRRA